MIRILMILGVLALAACETVEGAGRDLQHAGRAIERESYEARQ